MEIRHFFPGGHFQLLCVSSRDMSVYLHEIGLSYLFICSGGSERSFASFHCCQFFPGILRKSLLLNILSARITWYQFTTKAVILTLIYTSFHSQPLCDNCCHSNQTLTHNNCEARCEVITSAELRTLSVVAYTCEGESKFISE